MNLQVKQARLLMRSSGHGWKTVLNLIVDCQQLGGTNVRWTCSLTKIYDSSFRLRWHFPGRNARRFFHCLTMISSNKWRLILPVTDVSGWLVLELFFFLCIHWLASIIEWINKLTLFVCCSSAQIDWPVFTVPIKAALVADLASRQ